MRCQKCSTDNPGDSLFCGSCGGRLEITCAKCGADNPTSNKFCRKCGESLGASSSTKAAFEPLESSTPPDGERKTVTILFADIKGSMELMEDLDPEEARNIIDPALHLMMEAVHHYGGHVAQSTGDGIFSLFGAPIAHEDHPQRALYAALRMQDELRRYSDRLRAQGKSPLAIRVGANTGEVVVRSVRKDAAHADYLPAGHSTGLAERMQSLAMPGTIAVSEHTHKLTEGYFQFRALGPTKVKGLSEPINVYEVAGLGPLRTRLQRSAILGLSKFVGRQAEMEQMRRALEQAKSGRGQIVAAVGEPGVGKSRLYYEFKLTSPSECLVLEAFSVSHGKASAYLPVIELMNNYFRIGAQDDERSRREKVTGRVLALDRSLEDVLPHVFSLLAINEPGAGREQSSLLGLDPQVRRRRTLDAIKRLLLRESLNQPLILLFEDLHWLDSESQAFLDLLAGNIATARILLLVNYRPEYQHEWSGKTCYSQLRLDPLGNESATEMLTALVGEAAELQPVRSFVLDKTEGNPFFMEEMIQTLFDQGALVRNGSVRIAKPLADIRVPTTVQGILNSRIDRLAAEEKELLQTLAVIGKEFQLGVIKQVTARSEGALEPLLSKLQLAEFIYERPAFPEVEYTFKHALTQEVAYGSLLLERRRHLHEGVAQAIETLFAGKLDDHLSQLAHHYGRTANAVKAVHYFYLAGVQANQRWAGTEAIDRFTAALELLKALPDGVERARQEVAVQLALHGALTMTKGMASVEAELVLKRARDLCEQIGDEVQLLYALIGQQAIYTSRLELSAARDLGEKILAMAGRLQDPNLWSAAHFGQGLVSLWLGDPARAREHYERCIALVESRQANLLVDVAFSTPKISSLGAVAVTLWVLGYSNQALARLREGRELARRSSDSLGLAWTSLNGALLRWAIREPRTALAEAEASIAVSKEHGFVDSLAYAAMFRGWALAEEGRAEEGIAEMRWGLTARREAGAVAPAWMHVPLAETYLKLGRIEQGLDIVLGQLQALERTSERAVEAELLRLKGELLLARGTSDEREAENCFRAAIELARRQSARSWELRATTSVARLLAKQGKRDEARKMLAEIYGWFTEGFDTADLKDAKTLLDELTN